uniref:Uncharacterized protein n=1 Tax=Setaria italica TaxID=4555 RepID=K3YKQ2_SETIT
MSYIHHEYVCFIHYTNHEFTGLICFIHYLKRDQLVLDYYKATLTEYIVFTRESTWKQE